MAKLGDYYNEDTVALTEKLIRQRDEDFDWLLKFLERAKKNDLDAIYFLAHSFTRNSKCPEEIPVGVAWLLKIVDLYESGAFANTSSLVESPVIYYKAKRYLATIFLPCLPLINDVLKHNVGTAVPEDPEFGFQMLLDVCKSPVADSEDWISLSIAYFAGIGTKQDAASAKESLEMAIKLDTNKESPGVEPDFIEHISNLLESDPTGQTLISEGKSLTRTEETTVKKLQATLRRPQNE